MTYLLSFPIPSFEFLLKMTFRVMTKVMNNFKRLGNSTLNELVNENVRPLKYLKFKKTPEKSTSLAFFFEYKVIYLYTLKL